MAINQTCLESEIQTAVDNLTTSCSAEVFLETAIAADNANTNRKFSVALGCQLPDLATASIPAGTMVYVEELGVPVVATLQAWKGLDGRTYRKDIPDMQLWTWGYNVYGQLGDGTTTNRCSPVQEVTSAVDWCTFGAGFAHTAAIKTTGELYAWGYNLYGQLGDGTTTSSRSPVQEVTSATDWCVVSGGISHTAAIKTTGELYGWGNNGNGPLGDGTTTSSRSPVQEITSATDWCSISSGCIHTAAIKTTGELYAWGLNNYGHLGDGTTTWRSSPVQEVTSATDWCVVSSGWGHTVAIKTTGELYGWGLNNYGQLGKGTNATHSSPVQEITSATDWCVVSVGSDHTAAIKTTGELYAWGRNPFGTLGDGTTICRSSPVQEVSSATNWCTVGTGSFHTAAIKTTGELYAWGTNENGRLGDGTCTCRSSPVQEVSSAIDWCVVSGGFYHSFAIKVV